MLIQDTPLTSAAAGWSWPKAMFSRMLLHLSSKISVKFSHHLIQLPMRNAPRTLGTLASLMHSAAAEASHPPKQTSSQTSLARALQLPRQPAQLLLVLLPMLELGRFEYEWWPHICIAFLCASNSIIHSSYPMNHHKSYSVAPRTQCLVGKAYPGWEGHLAGQINYRIQATTVAYRFLS